MYIVIAERMCHKARHTWHSSKAIKDKSHEYYTTPRNDVKLCVGMMQVKVLERRFSLEYGLSEALG
jgi:hypothetical protein